MVWAKLIDVVPALGLVCIRNDFYDIMGEDWLCWCLGMAFSRALLAHAIAEFGGYGDGWLADCFRFRRSPDLYDR